MTGCSKGNCVARVKNLTRSAGDVAPSDLGKISENGSPPKIVLLDSFMEDVDVDLETPRPDSLFSFTCQHKQHACSVTNNFFQT